MLPSNVSSSELSRETKKEVENFIQRSGKLRCAWKESKSRSCKTSWNRNAITDQNLASMKFVVLVRCKDRETRAIYLTFSTRSNEIFMLLETLRWYITLLNCKIHPFESHISPLHIYLSIYVHISHAMYVIFLLTLLCYALHGAVCLSEEFLRYNR